MLPFQLLDLGTECGNPRCDSVVGGWFVYLAGDEQRVAVRAEDAPGEEAAN
jgi:hypothetical protein